MTAIERGGYAIGAVLSAALLAGSLLGSVPLDSTEVLGFITGAWGVWLTVKQNIWNWPIGILNNAFFLILFVRAHLFADSGLQVIYLILEVLGWYWWLHGGTGRTALPIGRLGPRAMLVLAAILIVATAALTVGLGRIDDSAPFWDALTTVLSLIAQYLLTRKLVENWLVWIAADVIYVALYAAKGLPLTAVLYALFFAMCVAGLLQWRTATQEQAAAASTGSGPAISGGDQATGDLGWPMPDKRFATGLVIGKFYPPHRGHSYLIDVACMHAARVTVVVCDHAEQTIPGRLRAAWLQEMHPEVTVMRIDDVYPSDDSRLWAALTVRWLGYAPDAVFSSEDYGSVYAGLMGSVHVLVDRARTVVPCSGTQVRADPLAWWDSIAPCVRAYFCARVVLIGAESSGKTTLAQALAERYRTVWVPEYGRAYCVTKMRGPNPTKWRTEEFVYIAREQCRQEDAAARRADRLLICDTDAFATSVWHERYMNAASEAVDSVASGHRPNLYVLTDVDIPFVQDGTRDGEHVRTWMHGRFIEALERDGRPYVVVRGPVEVRLEAASVAIDSMMRSVRRDEIVPGDMAVAPSG